MYFNYKNNEWNNNNIIATDDDNNIIIKCPLCHGSGSIQCSKEEKNYINSACIFPPVRDEERCNCCDGKGWVTNQQQKVSSFCNIYLHK
jgi:hypothetical protein